MSDPTAQVTVVTFCSALGLLGLGAAVKQFRAKSAPALAEAATPDVPNAEPSPPPLPTERPAGIATSFYNARDLIGVMVIFLSFLALTLANIAASSSKQQNISAKGLIASIVLQFLIAGGVMATVSGRIRPIEWLGLHWKKWPRIFLIAPATVVSMWLVFAAIQKLGYMKWTESLGAEPMQESVKLLQNSTNPTILWLMTIAAVIVAPLCEEVVFRGYLYPIAKRFAGPWVGALFSALVFGSAHGNLAALLPLVIFGLVLVFIYEKTGSLWANVSVHCCFNAATVAMAAVARIYHLPLDGPP